MVTCRYIFYPYNAMRNSLPLHPQNRQYQQYDQPLSPSTHIKANRPPADRDTHPPPPFRHAQGPYSCLPLSLMAVLLRMLSRSEFNFNFVMDTLEGLIPTGTLALLTFSFVTRSMWMTHFLR